MKDVLRTGCKLEQQYSRVLVEAGPVNVEFRMRQKGGGTLVVNYTRGNMRRDELL